MGSGVQKAAAVNLLVKSTTQWRDTMSKKEAANSNTYQAPGFQQAMTSLDAGPVRRRSLRAHRSSLSSDFRFS
jgi:hypothetical protein